MEEGVSLIIGPVFGDTVMRYRPLPVEYSAHQFFNNRSVAKPGVYIFGFSPEQQAARVVSFTLAGGKTRLAALPRKRRTANRCFRPHAAPC